MQDIKGAFAQEIFLFFSFKQITPSSLVSWEVDRMLNKRLSIAEELQRNISMPIDNVVEEIFKQNE